jgi:hypothetical protein
MEIQSRRQETEGECAQERVVQKWKEGTETCGKKEVKEVNGSTFHEY